MISLGPEGPLDQVRSVACRWDATAEGSHLWRVTLDLDAGRYRATLWVTGDGVVAGTRPEDAGRNVAR